jgi:hypothetical protein
VTVWTRFQRETTSWGNALSAPEDIKPSQATAASFSSFFDEWQKRLAQIVPPIAAVLGGWGLGEKWGAVAGCAVACTYLILLYLIWERAGRPNSGEWNLTTRELDQFRGLASFSEGDLLPGVLRRREAKTFARLLKTARSDFFVVCGDSGCGKTSFLQAAVQSELKEMGWEVVFVDGLFALDRTAFGGMMYSDAEKTLERLREWCFSLEPEKPRVIVFDQFEQFLIKFKTRRERRLIAGGLRGILSNRVATKLVLCVRTQDLLDLHDLSPYLPEPTSVNRVVSLENFSLDEAEGVIKECCDYGQIALESSFAHSLTSSMLVDNRVRPAEMQIICTALKGLFTAKRYELLGGYDGIMSDFIESAISRCADADLARLILRILCDFDNDAPRLPLLTAEILRDIAESKNYTRRVVPPTVEDILMEFERSRLAVGGKSPERLRTWSLAHGYLVGAVNSATRDVATEAEKADRLLRSFTRPGGVNHESAPSLRQLFYFRRNCSKNLWRPKSESRSYLTRMFVRKVVLSASLATAFAIAFAAATHWTRQHVWRQSVIGQHWPDRGRTNVFYVLSRDFKDTVVSCGGSFCCAWSTAINGDVNQVVPYRIPLQPSQRMQLSNINSSAILLVYDYNRPEWLGLIRPWEREPRVRSFVRPRSPAVATTETSTRPGVPNSPQVIANQPGGFVPAFLSPNFSGKNNYIVFMNFESFDVQTNQFTTVFDIRSIEDGTKIAEIKGHALTWTTGIVADDAQRAVFNYNDTTDSRRGCPSLWDLKKKTLVKLLKQDPDDRNCFASPYFFIDQTDQAVYSLEYTLSGKAYVCQWSVGDGTLLGVSEVPIEKIQYSPNVMDQAPALQLAAPLPSNEVYVIPQVGKKSPADSSSGGWRRHPTDFPDRSFKPWTFLVKKEGDTTATIWDMHTNKHFTVKGVNVTDDSILLLVGDGKTLVQHLQSDVTLLKLWATGDVPGDVQRPRVELTFSKRVLSYGPTLDDDLCVSLEGGELICYDGETGDLLANVDVPDYGSVVVKFDRPTQTLFVWSSVGTLYKYRRGMEYWGNWFVADARPSRRANLVIPSAPAPH